MEVGDVGTLNNIPCGIVSVKTFGVVFETPKGTTISLGHDYFKAIPNAWVPMTAVEYGKLVSRTPYRPQPVEVNGFERAIERLKGQIYWLRHGKLFDRCPMMSVEDMEILLASLQKIEEPVAAKCAECGTQSTNDHMVALYCVACIEAKIGPALLLPAEDYEKIEAASIDPVDPDGWGFRNRERFATLVRDKVKQRINAKGCLLCADGFVKTMAGPLACVACRGKDVNTTS